MGNYKQFFCDLNQSDTDRFSLWTKYRNQITSKIIEEVKQKTSSPLLLIIGSGSSDDIDLSRIVPYVQNITLADIDIASIEQSIIKYNLSIEDTIKKEIDFTSLSNYKDMDLLMSTLLKAKSHIEIRSIFNKLLNHVKSFPFDKLFSSKYDVIIISPIYTQLVLPVFMDVLTKLQQLNYPKDLFDQTQSSILETSAFIIEYFNISVKHLLNPEGRLIVLSDIFEATQDSIFYNKVQKIISDETQMDLFHQQYLDRYGAGAGDYGLEDLKSHFSQINHFWFDWPFEETKHFITLLAIYR